MCLSDTSAQDPIFNYSFCLSAVLIKTWQKKCLNASSHPSLPFPSATVTAGIAAKLVRVVQVLLLPLSLLENTCGFVKFHIGHVMHFICSSAKDLLVQSLLCVELPLTLVSCRKFKYSELHKLCIENRSESPRKEEKAHFGQFQKKHSSILTQLESNKII